MCYELRSSAAKSLQLFPTLCDPRDGSPPGSPVPGILQARTRVGCHFLFQCMKVKSESEVAQLCPTLRDPMDGSLPGSSSTHAIFQARVLEWVAIAFSSSDAQSCSILRDPMDCSPPGYWQVDSLSWVPPGKPQMDSLGIYSCYHLVQKIILLCTTVCFCIQSPGER